MCGPEVGRTIDSGDLIAIIHPNPRSSFRGKLRLSNRVPGATTSEWQFESSSRTMANGPLKVRIHKNGQLLSDRTQVGAGQSRYNQDSHPSNPVLHSFLTHKSFSSTAGIRLDLGVGGEGIIGRTVSVLDAQQEMLGQGIIGWS